MEWLYITTNINFYQILHTLLERTARYFNPSFQFTEAASTSEPAAENAPAYREPIQRGSRLGLRCILHNRSGTWPNNIFYRHDKGFVAPADAR